jgi:hypothetical protein
VGEYECPLILHVDRSPYASPIGEPSSAIIPMPLKRSVPPASSESDQLVVDGLVLSMPPSSARKS